MKSLIWHESLSAVYSECPYCHCHNTVDDYTGICRYCKNKSDTINIVERKSKDVIECERLGLHGPVHKNEKGQWEEWVDPYKVKEAIHE